MESWRKIERRKGEEEGRGIDGGEGSERGKGEEGGGKEKKREEELSCFYSSFS